jgi:2-polyprenyl-3-methyl-5-hydroxy-6-metoxy-1,4-benzoquinol methylase
MAPPTRWATHRDKELSQFLIDRFRRLAAEGADLAGEARTVNAIVGAGASVLDAGCGTGRVGSVLAGFGHPVVGVDADPKLIAAAREDHPDIEWIVGDLSELDLGRTFDAAVLAGNVMPFVAPDTEVAVLRTVAAHVAGDGPIVVGFDTDRGYAVSAFDVHIAAAGLRVDNRFGTWDLRPWQPDSDYAVSVLRRAAD